MWDAHVPVFFFLQATVMALQALATFAENLMESVGTQDFDAQVMYNNKAHTFERITDSNNLLVQSYQVILVLAEKQRHVHLS